LLAEGRALEGLVKRLDMKGDDLVWPNTGLDELVAQERRLEELLLTAHLEVLRQDLTVSIYRNRLVHVSSLRRPQRRSISDSTSELRVSMGTREVQLSKGYCLTPLLIGNGCLSGRMAVP
jgi:hypothetical protein